MNRKQVLGWALYDFANSVYPAVISVTVFAIYFTDAVVGNDEGLGDLWWGRVISISMLFVALSSPIMGSIADRAGVRKRMLAIYTALCILSVLLFVTIEPGMILWAVLLAVIANIGFEGAMVFYNAYLPDLVPTEKQGGCPVSDSVSAIWDRRWGWRWPIPWWLKGSSTSPGSWWRSSLACSRFPLSSGYPPTVREA